MARSAQLPPEEVARLRYDNVAYGHPHRGARKQVATAVASGTVRCARGAQCFEAVMLGGKWVGGLIRPDEPWDLGHVDGTHKTQYSGAEHRRCNRAHWGRRFRPDPVEEQPEPKGLPRARFDVPWLKTLRRVPKDATWPRYQTCPHPRAAGSLGPEFIRWAERRSGRRLRWWQRLVATRLLEVDDAGILVWETALLTTSRQVGKSWLLRELLLWRIHQAERFGEEQTALHTAKDLQAGREVLRSAMAWAEERPGFKVTRASGDMSIEKLDDLSRWLLRSKGAVYGYSAGFACVDEAWKVAPSVVNEGLAPTQVERAQPQLVLLSTAHRMATPLMLVRRKLALADLAVGDGDLIIEWSAPRDAALDSVKAWRMASPHWTRQRERMIGKALEAVQAGEGEITEDEGDPTESFKAQWLNVWPTRSIALDHGEPLLTPGLWAYLEEQTDEQTDLYVAVEDDFGQGAAVAAAAVLSDGRVELDGWLCRDWESALADVRKLGQTRRIRELYVGASMLTSVPLEMTPAPQPAGRRETAVGLALLRDLCAGEEIVHDKTPELDEAIAAAQVRELSSGLQLSPSGATHLVRAAVWAAHAAHRPAPVPAIY